MILKFRKLIQAYYFFFDHKLKNTTVIIGLVGTLILCVGILIGGKHNIEAYNMKSNIIELKPDQIMSIGGAQYRISLTKMNQ